MTQRQCGLKARSCCTQWLIWKWVLALIIIQKRVRYYTLGPIFTLQNKKFNSDSVNIFYLILIANFLWGQNAYSWLYEYAISTDLSKWQKFYFYLVLLEKRDGLVKWYVCVVSRLKIYVHCARFSSAPEEASVCVCVHTKQASRQTSKQANNPCRVMIKNLVS